jgi:LmbE family N-acetylglucosaminyl deacetylase
MRTAPSAPVVVLSPHLDDAVWSTFSVLSSAQHVVVANVFAGIPEGPPGWWDARCGITDSAAHVRARRAEDASVLATLGRSPVDLDLLDDQYRDGPVAAAEIVAELERHVPAVSHVYAPAGIGHPDHALVRDAGVLLREQGVRVSIYTDYCYCTREGWPTWIAADGRPEADRQWRDAIGAVVGEGLAHPRVVRLDAEQSDRKLAAMKGYVSQFEATEAEEPNWNVHGKPASDPEMRVVEVFYDLPLARAAA